MKHERIYLYPDDKSVFLDTYAVIDPLSPKKDAMLVIPGGGYSQVCSDREGEPIALAFAAKGMNSFVLTYSVGEQIKYPRQLLDAALAMKYIKEHADEYQVNSERIFGVGFSAGGHLLGALTTLHGEAEKILGLPEDYLRLTGSVFSYAVLSAYTFKTHSNTYFNLLRKPLEEYTEEEKLLHSVELNVNEKTSPAFIWHTSEDKIVPVDGSVRLALAYIEAGIPVELHIYPNGPHGIALANDVTSHGNSAYLQSRAEEWVDKAYTWTKTV